MVSIIVTSFKEPKTIGKCIKCIADRKYSGISTPFEIIQVSPDDLTIKAGMKAAHELNLSKHEYKHLRDPQYGKPYALTMALKKAKGEIVILTDGDTFFDKKAVENILVPFKDSTVGGVSGRPISQDSMDNMFGYWGHLLSDAADDRRKKTDKFFPMSGYIMAIRNIPTDIPEDVLSDDAYISYMLKDMGLKIVYAPEARCFVKYPTNLRDYFKQKIRSIGGFTQLQQMGVLKKEKQTRSLWIELGYFFFPLKYAKTFKEFIWSLCLYPIRLLTWVRIFWEKGILRKGMPKNGWERIESTK